MEVTDSGVPSSTGCALARAGAARAMLRDGEALVMRVESPDQPEKASPVKGEWYNLPSPYNEDRFGVRMFEVVHGEQSWNCAAYPDQFSMWWEGRVLDRGLRVGARVAYLAVPWDKMLPLESQVIIIRSQCRLLDELVVTGPYLQ